MKNTHLNQILQDFDLFCNPSMQCCGSKGFQTYDEKRWSISEDTNHYYVDAEVPGATPDNVKVTIDPQKRKLQIKAQTQLNRNEVHYHLRGITNHAYEIPLSSDIDLSQPIDAVTKDGILSITLTKNQGHKPLRVDVKVA